MSYNKMWPCELKEGMAVEDAFGRRSIVSDVSIYRGRAEIKFQDGTSRKTGVLAQITVVEISGDTP